MIIVCPVCHTKNKFPDPTDKKKKYMYNCRICKTELSIDGKMKVYRGQQEKDWESFEKLSSQEKFENLWQHIWDLQHALSSHRMFHADALAVMELEENTNNRFREVYDCLNSLGARNAVFETLASFKSSGPVNTPCPDCGKLTLVRKRSEYSPEDTYVLECLSCPWSQEIEC